MFSTLRVAATAALASSALCLGGTAVSQASWSEYHVGTESTPIGATGSVPVALSAGPARLVVNASVKLECTTAGASGAFAAGLYTYGVSAPVLTGGPTFSSCTGPLGLAFTVVCSNPPGGVTNLSVTNIPTPFTGTTAGQFSGIYCVVRMTATGCSATVSGSVQGEYRNPATPSTAGKITVFTAGQSLTVSGSGCPAIIPNGTGQFGAPVGTGTGLANIDYTVSGAISGQPYITPTT